MNIQQQLLLPLVRKTGKAAFIVPNAVMAAVVVKRVDTADFQFTVNAFLQLFVRI